MPGLRRSMGKSVSPTLIKEKGLQYDFESQTWNQGIFVLPAWIDDVLKIWLEGQILRRQEFVEQLDGCF